MSCSLHFSHFAHLTVAGFDQFLCLGDAGESGAIVLSTVTIGSRSERSLESSPLLKIRTSLGQAAVKVLKVVKNSVKFFEHNQTFGQFG